MSKATEIIIANIEKENARTYLIKFKTIKAAMKFINNNKNEIKNYWLEKKIINKKDDANERN